LKNITAPNTLGHWFDAIEWKVRFQEFLQRVLQDLALRLLRSLLQLAPEFIIHADSLLELPVLLSILQPMRLIGVSLRIFPNLGSLGINASSHLESEGLLLLFQFPFLFPQEQFSLPALL
jgi:hypothetical protein